MRKKKKGTEENQETEGKKKSKRKRRGEKDEIVRIEELEELLSKHGDEVEPETIVSMYMPHRKRRKLGAALLRLDRLQLILLSMLLLVAILFIAAFMQEKMGNFTINLTDWSFTAGHQHRRQRRGLRMRRPA